MFDGKFWLQIIVAHTVAGYTLIKCCGKLTKHIQNKRREKDY